MGKKLFILALVVVVGFILTGTAMAIAIGDLGKEITINDMIPSNPNGSGQANEDNEVERNSVLGQKWDLEGIFWDGTTLSVVAGFDFRTGENGRLHYSIGDLFVGPQYDAAGIYTGSTDYVFDFSRNGDELYGINGTFDIIQNPVGFVSTSSSHVSESNPYQYDSGGTNVGTGQYTVSEILVGGYFSDWPTKGGGSHFVLQMSGDDPTLFAGIVSNRLLHLTEECGNDTIRGRASVPEPATMILISCGLVGIAGFRRRNLLRK